MIQINTAKPLATQAYRIIRLHGNTIAGLICSVAPKIYAQHSVYNGIHRLYTGIKWKASVRLTHVRRKVMALMEHIAAWIVGIFAPMLAQAYFNRQPPAIRTYGRYHIVGLKYNDGVAKTGDRVELCREPGNPWDKYAIRCYNSNDKGIGYIARAQAAQIAPMMDRGAKLYAVVRGKVDQYRLIVDILEM